VGAAVNLDVVHDRVVYGLRRCHAVPLPLRFNGRSANRIRKALDPEAGIAKRVELDFQSTRKLDGSILPFAVPPSIWLSVEETPGVLPINWRNQLW
jgi:hypothetical protein